MQFCSDHSRALNEPVHGLGYLPERLAVLTWPRTLWGPSVAEARQLPQALRNAFEQAEESGLLRVQLVPGSARNRSTSKLNLHLFPYRRFWEGISPDEAADLIQGACQPGPQPIKGGQPYTRQLILCCTDSKVDACCAKFGKALSRELHRQTANDADIEVLETTHVGGCRLAASCIVMPQRARYSRMAPDQVSPFLDALRQGGIYPPCYRGDPGYEELQQVVMAEARSWAYQQGLFGTPGDPVVEFEDHHEATCRVLVDMGEDFGQKELRVHCRVKDFIIYSNCKDRSRGIDRPFPRWIVDKSEVLP